MKVTIGENNYYISWRYQYITRRKNNITFNTRITTCVIKNDKTVIRKKNDKRKTDIYDKEIIIETGVHTFDTSLTSKSKDRKLALDLALNSLTGLALFSKEDREFIWNNYKATQHNNLSDDKLSVKRLISEISKLDSEQKERIRIQFFEQKLKDNVITMHKEENVAHA